MVNKIFIDTNVLIDVFTERAPFYDNSAAIWTIVETSCVSGFISAISFNNIHYFLSRVSTKQKAKKALVLLRDIFEIVPLDEKILNMAIDANFKDFEDAIQYYSAVRIGADTLITRNKKDFKRTGIPIMSPDEFLALNFKQ